MVTQKEEERRDRPEYSLHRVREMAAQGNVRYLSSRVTTDVENLEFTPDNVHECLRALEERHFRGSVRYEGTRAWLDEYLITCKGQRDIGDNLYIKLKLDRDCIWIYLASFHRER